MKYYFFPLSFLCLLFSCSSPSERINQNGDAAEKKADTSAATAVDGAQVFKQFCVVCHGADGKLGMNGAKNLGESVLNKAERITMITNGKGIMTPFGEILSEAEIAAVADYTFTFKEK